MNKISENIQSEDQIELQEYLTKFIELVPNLKQIKQEENLNKITFSSNATESSQSQQNYLQQLENLQNLDLNSKTLSDLQILQSVLDYIVDLKSKVDL